MKAQAFRFSSDTHVTEGWERQAPLRDPKNETLGGRQQMEITRSGSQPSGKGPTEYFTGAVRIDPLVEAPDPARVRAASVTFEPGARTA